MDDVQTHLTVYSQQWLIASDRLSDNIIFVNHTRDLLLTTHSGNSPFTRAMYSFLTVPATNSSVSTRARSDDSAIIIRPDVSRSSRLTARISDLYQSAVLKQIQSIRLTVHIFETKLIFEDLNHRVFEIAASSVHWL